MDLEAPPWLDTGDISAPFDFCARVQALCADIVERCEELWHIDISRLLFDVTQARTNERHGLQARVTPLRFRDGRTTRRRGGVLYRVQQYVVNDVEMLYLVTFCLPRFLDQSFDEKFITLFHELFHISPSFNGDFRRFPGRCSLHTHNQKQFDARMAKLARVYLATNPDPALYSFLRLNFARLQHRHGSVVGVMLPRPRLIPHQED
jgi:predicted metallopeptidase